MAQHAHVEKREVAEGSGMTLSLAERLYRVFRPGRDHIGRATLSGVTPGAASGATSGAASGATHRGVIWLHAGDQVALDKLAALSDSLLNDHAGCFVLLTCPQGLLPPDAQEKRMILTLDPDHGPNCLAVLKAMRPAVLLIAAATLLPTLIETAGKAGLRVMVAGMHAPALPGLWGNMPGLMTRVIRHLDRVFLSDAAQARAWRRARLDPDRLIIAGPLDDTPPTLSCNDAEREALAQAFRQRTVWLAVDLPEGEEGQIIAAHREALRESLRVVLILNPLSPLRGPALKQALQGRFNTALRSEDELITPETQIYIADTEAERGLWYRLSTVCHIGGSLSPGGASVNPLEAAALGCVIVHGPAPGRFDAAFRRLKAAQACMSIRQPDELGRAICASLSPEAAARMAHQGWQVIASTAEARDIVIDTLLQALSNPRGMTEA